MRSVLFGLLGAEGCGRGVMPFVRKSVACAIGLQEKEVAVYYEACNDDRDVRKLEKYLKSRMGKKYMRNSIKNYLKNL